MKTEPAPNGPNEDDPREGGYFVARRKNRALYDQPGWMIVKVSRHGTAGPFSVYQHADERSWPVENWEWKEKIWPGRDW